MRRAILLSQINGNFGMKNTCALRGTRQSAKSHELTKSIANDITRYESSVIALIKCGTVCRFGGTKIFRLSDLFRGASVIISSCDFLSLFIAINVASRCEFLLIRRPLIRRDDYQIGEDTFRNNITKILFVGYTTVSRVALTSLSALS